MKEFVLLFRQPSYDYSDVSKEEIATRVSTMSSTLSTCFSTKVIIPKLKIKFCGKTFASNHAAGTAANQT